MFYCTHFSSNLWPCWVPDALLGSLSPCFRSSFFSPSETLWPVVATVYKAGRLIIMSATFSDLTNIEVDRSNETVSQTFLGDIICAIRYRWTSSQLRISVATMFGNAERIWFNIRYHNSFLTFPRLILFLSLGNSFLNRKEIACVLKFVLLYKLEYNWLEEWKR